MDYDRNQPPESLIPSLTRRLQERPAYLLAELRINITYSLFHITQSRF